MSVVVTKERAASAIELATPSILAAMDAGATNRKHLYCIVAVRNPRISSGYQTIIAKSFGTVEEWEHPYDQIATGKVEITARTGLSSREVQFMQPYLLSTGDVKFFGSVIAGDIIVACSGVQAWYDETFAKMILGFVLADIENAVQQSRLSAGPVYRGI